MTSFHVRFCVSFLFFCLATHKPYSMPSAVTLHTHYPAHLSRLSLSQSLRLNLAGTTPLLNSLSPAPLPSLSHRRADPGFSLISLSLSLFGL